MDYEDSIIHRQSETQVIISQSTGLIHVSVTHAVLLVVKEDKGKKQLNEPGSEELQRDRFVGSRRRTDAKIAMYSDRLWD